MSDIIIFRKGKIEVNPIFDRILKNFNDNQTDKIIGLKDIGLIAIKGEKDEKEKKRLIDESISKFDDFKPILIGKNNELIIEFLRQYYINELLILF